MEEKNAPKVAKQSRRTRATAENHFGKLVQGAGKAHGPECLGINGGISNGNPLTLRVGFRPTPSIEKEQQTVDLDKFENVKISVKGRHDSCFAVRAVPVVESVVAIAILDSILAEIK
jgi:chorismate synthase